MASGALLPIEWVEPYSDGYVDDALLGWMGINEIAHQAYYGAALKQLAQVYPKFALDGDPFEEGWYDAHASEHDSLNSILGLGLPPMGDYNLTDPAEFQDFMDFHREVHSRIDRALGF